VQLTLELDCDAHSSEDEDISAQCDSDPGGTTDANFTQWTNNTNCPTVHKFAGGPGGFRQAEVPHISKDSLPPSIYMLFFFEIIQLLVEEINGYYHQYLDTLEEGQFSLPDVTIQEMCLFLTIIVRMGHKITARHRYSTS